MTIQSKTDASRGGERRRTSINLRYWFELSSAELFRVQGEDCPGGGKSPIGEATRRRDRRTL